METLDLITQKFIEPLNDATKKLLAPIRIAQNDHLHIELDEHGKRFIFNFYAMSYSETVTHPSWGCRRFMQRIPERKEINSYPTQKWFTACTDFTCILVNAVWPKSSLSFTDEAENVYNYLLLRFLKQTQNSAIKAQYKLNRVVPELPDDFVDHPVRPLMTSQRVALASSIGEEGSNLWMEQGTGKTPIVIARVCYEAHRLYAKQKRMYRALIVVPKNMRMNWHNKFLDFAVHPGKLTVLRGGQLQRIKLIVEAFKTDDTSEYTVVICSYETVLRSWDAIRMIEWDFASLDEAHMIKGHTTKRWQKMRDLRERCAARTGLTGTPIANNLFDSWTQLEWLGEGFSGFTSYKAYKAYYGRFIKPEDGHQVLAGYDNLPILQERFARLCFQITRAEAMPELPQKTYDIYEVEMTKFQRDCYVKLAKTLALEIEAALSSSKNLQLTTTNVLTKLLRLSQITAGYLKWDEVVDEEGNVSGGHIQEINPNPKIDALIEILKAKAPTDKTIVWTNWVKVIEMVSARLTAEGIKHVKYYGATSEDDRQLAQDSYNIDPEVKVFIGNPAAGGVGLDLWGHIPEWAGTDKDHGCNTTQEIYMSQSWSMIHRAQSEDRAVRRGTRVSVQITDLIMPQTIDEEIACRVLDKKMNAIQLQDVKAIMAKILTTIPNIGDDNV